MFALENPIIITLLRRRTVWPKQLSVSCHLIKNKNISHVVVSNDKIYILFLPWACEVHKDKFNIGLCIS
jgi:hypothetical protein